MKIPKPVRLFFARMITNTVFNIFVNIIFLIFSIALSIIGTLHTITFDEDRSLTLILTDVNNFCEIIILFSVFTFCFFVMFNQIKSKLIEKIISR